MYLFFFVILNIFAVYGAYRIIESATKRDMAEYVVILTLIIVILVISSLGILEKITGIKYIF